MGRGGIRPGAGRKRKEPSKRMSIPESKVKAVQELLDGSDNEDEAYFDKPLPLPLERFIETLPEYQYNIDGLTQIGLFFEDWEALRNLPRKHRQIIIKMLKGAK